MDWITIITSAAVASLVSGGLSFVNSWRERTARKRELLLAKAIEMAKARTDMVLALAEKVPGATATIRDNIELAEDYYRLLEHLMEKSKLPAGWQKAVDHQVLSPSPPSPRRPAR